MDGEPGADRIGHAMVLLLDRGGRWTFVVASLFFDVLGASLIGSGIGRIPSAYDVTLWRVAEIGAGTSLLCVGVVSSYIALNEFRAGTRNRARQGGGT